MRSSVLRHDSEFGPVPWPWQPSGCNCTSAGHCISVEPILEILERIQCEEPMFYRHLFRVARSSWILAEALGWDDARMTGLANCAMLHDIGKIVLPRDVLWQHHELLPEEIALVKGHPSLGRDILLGLAPCSLMREAAETAYAHHERFDGTGYPLGLAGEAIPIASRIIAMADVIDALLSVRSYKRPWSIANCKVFVELNSGAAFDPLCVEACLSVWPKIVSIYPGYQPLPGFE